VLTIVDGSLEKVKAEMKQLAKFKTDEIKQVKNKIQSWVKAEKKAAKEEKRKENTIPNELQEKLEGLERDKERYSSAVVPVRVRDIVINFAVYSRAFTKLKDVVVYPEEVEGHELIIRYREGKRGSVDCTKARGQIHLYDISRLFSELKHIPIAEIQKNGQEN
jgi:hypothetical protein